MHFIFIIVRIKSMYKKGAVIGGCEIETSNLFDVPAGGVVRAPFSLAIRDTEMVAGEKHRGKQTSRAYIYMCMYGSLCTTGVVFFVRPNYCRGSFRAVQNFHNVLLLLMCFSMLESSVIINVQPK